MNGMQRKHLVKAEPGIQVKSFLEPVDRYLHGAH